MGVHRTMRTVTTVVQYYHTTVSLQLVTGTPYTFTMTAWFLLIYFE